jgi:signal peptidase I
MFPRIIYVLAVLPACAVAMYLAGFRVFKVPTHGMDPTIRANELVVGHLSDRVRNSVTRFDLVIFRTDFTQVAPNQIFVKRVIGLPGETIEISEKGILADGHSISLPFSTTPKALGTKSVTKKLGADEFFVVGDNLSSSLDSRYFGALPRSEIVGKLVFKK